MKTGKLFMNGGSQAIRLPKEYRIEGDDVFIEKVGNTLVIIPQKIRNNFDWRTWYYSFDKSDIERDQPDEQQVREGLDDLFA